MNRRKLKIEVNSPAKPWTLPAKASFQRSQSLVVSPAISMSYSQSLMHHDQPSNNDQQEVRIIKHHRVKSILDDVGRSMHMYTTSRPYNDNEDVKPDEVFMNGIKYQTFIDFRERGRRRPMVRRRLRLT